MWPDLPADTRTHTRANTHTDDLPVPIEETVFPYAAAVAVVFLARRLVMPLSLDFVLLFGSWTFEKLQKIIILPSSMHVSQPNYICGKLVYAPIHVFPYQYPQRATLITASFWRFWALKEKTTQRCVSGKF